MRTFLSVAACASTQFALLTCVAIITLHGGMLGREFAAHPVLAAVPIFLLTCAPLCAILPAAKMSAAWGRRKAFAGALTLSALGSVTAALSAHFESYLLLSASCFMLGATLAFGGQLRFAAAECAPNRLGAALTAVLVGGMAGSLTGADMGSGGMTVALAFCVVLPAHALAAIMLLASSSLRPPLPPSQSGRLLRAFRVPRIRALCLASAAGYAFLLMVLTALPIAMRAEHGHSMADAALALQCLILSQNLLPLLVPWLLHRIGASALVALGAAVLLLAAGVGIAGGDRWQFLLCAGMSGAGWCLLHIGCTASLMTAYGSRRILPVAQVAYDLTNYSATAVAALAAGILVNTLGWGVTMTCAAFTLAVPVALVAAKALPPYVRAV